MVSKLLLVQLLLLALTLTATPARADDDSLAAAPTSTTATSGLAVIHKVMGLVHQEYRIPVPASQLVGGALMGMRHYLQEQKQNPTVVDVPAAAGQLTPALLDNQFHHVLAVDRDASTTPLAEAAVRGMLSTLGDPYTVYMDRREYSGLMEQMDGGNFGGLGIYIELDDKHGKRLTVVEPMEDSPAEKAGIRAGDIITQIDGVSTLNMTLDDASKRLRGQEGSPITLTILRDGQAAPFDVTMNRAHIQMKTVSHKIVDGNIGYARLRIFGENTGAELEDAMRDFDQHHVQGYILDLRNNGGGYINTALEVCSKFLPTGSRVVSVVERDQPEAVYSSLPNVRPRLPLVVLVNKYSASASEITAGAMQDLHAGTLVGQHTFGKGSVQKIFPLPDGTAVKITTAHYHTPAGRDIHQIGIDPSVALDMDPHDVGADNDKQMAQAVTTLEQAIAKTSQPQASTGSTRVASTGVNAIPVGDPNEEYDYVQNHPCDKDGSSLMIVSQKTVQVDGRTYDQVIARCKADGHEQTFLFDLTGAMSH